MLRVREGQMKSRERSRGSDDEPYLVSPPIIQETSSLAVFYSACPSRLSPSASMDS